ncbi:YihA family ribosome biogenesis GTP-binding protein [Hymenobacter sp. HMF4947]|uniref:Probable GTP-binding protein EngB n=1 Tax=Hymenobacter ginkgonis TaxID=2682976 RepID=A0A7K1TBE1_9BACT|nr:ribosome biogenesis GTP-binding protein YihA/YsxC [Hymenobacter ginkgonis]MVN75511.1 YihA family ribosome biogenesis GTP-binding protein [Hymenobacter ginkgonis]
MLIREASFLSSNTQVALCPPPNRPEYAFIGRSNVGKSSLINMLTGRLALAKTSGTPGKTQLINHFNINDEWYLVDLPGYGYARVSKTSRADWSKMINSYLTKRENLTCVCVLLDSRHPPQAADLEFMEKLGAGGVPFVMIFTKTDKQSASRTYELINAYLTKMRETWDELPRHFVTSAETGVGREDVLDFIEEVNRQVAADAAGA